MSVSTVKKHVFRIAPDTIASFRRYLELDEKEGATIRKYLHDVEVFLDFQQNRTYFGKEQVIEYKSWLAERYAVRSANSMLTALNQFLKFIGAESCCVKPFKLQYQTFCDQSRELTREEYKRLLDAARSKKQIRLYLLLLTLCTTGIRISELKYVTVEGVREGCTVVRNKGKSRMILIPRRLCEVLCQYAAWKTIQSGPIFITRTGNPLNRSNIWRAMQGLCREAGVSPLKAHPHNLRHLFACTFYEKEKDILHLADILGHKNINTTRIYTLSGGELHRAQIESLNLFIPEGHSLEELCLMKQHNDTLCCLCSVKLW